jgi:hypothetical protein
MGVIDMAQINLRRPRQLAQLAEIYANADIRNRQTMQSAIKQRQESEAMGNIAKLYREQVGAADADINSILGAGSDAVFGLARFGRNAEPIISAIGADNKIRASIVQEAMRSQRAKPVNYEQVKLSKPVEIQGGYAYEWVADRDPYTLQVVPGSERRIPAGAAPGASSAATQGNEQQVKLEQAQNLVNSEQSDAEFMKELARYSKDDWDRMQSGDYGSILGGTPQPTAQRIRSYVDALTTVKKMAKKPIKGTVSKKPQEDNTDLTNDLYSK